MFNINCYEKIMIVFKHICVLMLSEQMTPNAEISLTFLVEKLSNPSMTNLKKVIADIELEEEDVINNKRNKPNKPNPSLQKFESVVQVISVLPGFECLKTRG